MKKLILFTLMIATFSVSAQTYLTRTGHISFYSKAPLEDIEAHNHQSTVMLKTESNEMAFKVVMKSFEFEKALMQEHFNENYVESDKYPNATFNGKILNSGEVDFTKDGTYNATVEGEMTIHGITNTVKEDGTITVKNGKIDLDATFDLTVADYDIKIPMAVKDNIAKTIKITVDASLEEFKR